MGIDISDSRNPSPWWKQNPRRGSGALFSSVLGVLLVLAGGLFWSMGFWDWCSFDAGIHGFDTSNGYITLSECPDGPYFSMVHLFASMSILLGFLLIAMAIYRKMSSQNPSTPKVHVRWKSNVTAVVILAIVGVGYLIFRSSNTGSSLASTSHHRSEPKGLTSRSTSLTTNPAQPVTFTGDGEVNTPSQEIGAGNYIASLTVQGSCSYYINVQQVGTQDYLNEQQSTETISLDSTSSSLPAAASTSLYGVAAGTYYASAITGSPPLCPWTLTLTPTQ